MSFFLFVFYLSLLFAIYRVVELSLKRYERLKAMQKLEGEELIAYLGKAEPERKSDSLEQSKWWLIRIASLLIGAGITLALSPFIVNWGIEFGEANKLSSDLNAFAVIGCGFLCCATALLIELVIEHRVRKPSKQE